MNKYFRHIAKTDNILLLLILLTGTLLRVYHLHSIPFMNDELSAINRLEFSSFNDLIKFGVVPDGHPAGIQIFLYYYVKLFGNAEATVKLPFIIMGILSIVLIYAIGKTWFNSTSALLSSVLMSTLQISVMYSQIARPYISGVFVTLLFVYFWSKIVIDKKQSIFKYFMFLLSGAICAYNHHFSLLMAAIISATGFLFIDRKFTKTYLLLLVLMAFLYLPHLKIFLAQLHNQGLEWLGKPQQSFFKNYILYVFNFSPILIGSLLLAVLIPYMAKQKVEFSNIKIQLILLLWTILPFLIGYYYSIYQKPVIQFSVLIFSFPFLIIFISSFVPNLKPAFKSILIVSILVVGVYTLVFERLHYQIFYKQPFKESAQFIWKSKANNNNTLRIISNLNPDYLNYYLNHTEDKHIISIFQKNASQKDIREMIDNIDYSKLMLLNPQPVLKDIALEKYQFIINQEHGFTFDLYYLSKTNDNIYIRPFIRNICDTFELPVKIDKKHEYLNITSLPLKNIITNKASEIHISAEIKLMEIRNDMDVSIISSIEKDGKSYDWRGEKFNNALNTNDTLNWQKIYHSFILNHIIKNEKDIEELQFNTFIWNKSGEEFLVRNIKIDAFNGNRFLYGLYEKL